MSRIHFVGFQEHFEIPEDSELVEMRVEIECDFDEKEAFSLIGEAQYLSQWFYVIDSFESKPGGKLIFRDHNDVLAKGICTSYRPGKEVSLLSDEFGEFVGRVHRINERVWITLHLKSFEKDQAAKRFLYENFASRLRELSW
jgi:hypothetical protein